MFFIFLILNSPMKKKKPAKVFSQRLNIFRHLLSPSSKVPIEDVCPHEKNSHEGGK